MKEAFFHVVSLADCVSLFKTFGPVPAVSVDLPHAWGMALAEDVVASEDLPLANRSCVDGYALKAKDSFGATESNPGYLDLAFAIDIQNPPRQHLGNGQCAKIPTGGCLPEGADAVIMVEQTLLLGADTVEIKKSLSPWENVMLRGEDVEQGRQALAAGTRLKAAYIGLLAALGVNRVSVHRRVLAGILSTGDEVVDITHPVRPGLVRDVNSHTLAALAASGHARVREYGLVRDQPALIKAKLEQALEECDVVLVSGGSSVGGKDHTLEAISQVCAGQVLVHGLAMSPGKPTIVARAGARTIIGLPGQVASAQVVMQVLIQPLLAHLAGCRDAFSAGWDRFPAVISRNIASRQGRTDFIRVHLQNIESRLPLATPVTGKSGLLKTLVQADGLVEIPENSEGLLAGQEILVRPLK